MRRARSRSASATTTATRSWTRIGEGAFAHVFRARETGARPRLSPSRCSKRSTPRCATWSSASSARCSPSRRSTRRTSCRMLDFGFADERVLHGHGVRAAACRCASCWTHEPWAPEDVLVVVGTDRARAHGRAQARDRAPRSRSPRTSCSSSAAGSVVAKVLDFGFAKLAELERTLELRADHARRLLLRHAAVSVAGADRGPLRRRRRRSVRARRHRLRDAGRPAAVGRPRSALGDDGGAARRCRRRCWRCIRRCVSRIEEVNRFLLRVLEKERGGARPTRSRSSTSCRWRSSAARRRRGRRWPARGR